MVILKVFDICEVHKIRISYDVSVHSSITHLKVKPIFEWCGFKNRCQKYVCSKEIAL